MAAAGELEKLTGRTLGGYRLRECIGKGGMAVVFKAEELDTGRILAVKVMRPSLDAEPDFRKRIAREAKIASRLKHPNIVRVHSIQERDGLFFLVMDYIEGASLFAVERRRGAFPFKEAAIVMKGILEALAFAHGKKVVHRDIKPENVIISSSGTPMLTDFGIAKPLEGTKLTKTGLALGTPLYMSPEQVRGEKDIDIRSDVYSAGVLFYELLCGKVPFDGDDPIAIGYRHVNSAPVRPSCFNPALTHEHDVFVLKAMEKERVHRYKDVARMLEALDRLCEGRPLELDLVMKTRVVEERSSLLGPLGKAAAITLAAAAVLAGAVYLRDGDLDVLGGALSSVYPFSDDEFDRRDPLAEAKALLAEGRYAEAMGILNEEDGRNAIDESGKKSLAARLYAAGVKSLESGDAMSAVRLLQLSYRFDRKRADTCFQLAKAYLKQDKYRLAASYFGQTMRLLDPERAYEFIEINEPLYFSKLPKVELRRIGADLCDVGRRLFRKGRSDRALYILRKALHYKEDQLEAHQALARIYEARGEKAKMLYHKKRYTELFDLDSR